MLTTTDQLTTLTLYLTLKDRRTDLVAAVDHSGYNVLIDGTAYEATVSSENDRYAKLTVTLGEALSAGEYLYQVFSMSASGTSANDRNAEVERGTLRVTKTASNYSEPSVSSSYAEP
jgi:hypothetical protein